MLERLKEKLKNKLPHHAVVVFSSFIYFVAAILVEDRDMLIVFLLFLVFVTSIFYHSYPHNVYFRIADWIASVSLIVYIARFIKYYDASYHLLGALGVVCIVAWLISEVAYKKEHDLTYNISHTIWHIVSGILLPLIVLNV